jgi:hypothetical protein
MSFLSKNNSEFLSVRITQKGRNYISKGNFNISYFQIGDSEFDYTPPFNDLTGLGLVPHQSVFSPMNKEGGVKYPYKIDNSATSTVYGVPIQMSTTDTIRNVMGPAGFVSEYKEYDPIECTGAVVECTTQSISISSINGSSSVTVLSGTSFNNCEFITLVFTQFGGTDPNYPVVTGISSSLIYKVLSISGNTLFLDRPTPILTGCTGNAQVICNSCENEYPLGNDYNTSCRPVEIDPSQQLNSWKMELVWGDKPIGFDTTTIGVGPDESLSGFTSNKHVSTKQFLGYTTSSGQTFSNFTGGTITYPTSYYNSYGERIEVSPEEQRCVAIIHYSELGDLKNDPERFFKYDDYISTNNIEPDALLEDSLGYTITDLEYFEIYIPFIQYHRNSGTTIGALFTMDTIDYYVNSKISPNQRLLFRYLLDENGNKVGKIFVNNKVAVFDDQELVAILDYKSNRKYTLPAPKVTYLPSDTSSASSFFQGNVQETTWVTYMFTYSGDTALNGLPCNYYTKFSSTSGSTFYQIPSNLYVKFDGNFFSNMLSSNKPCDATNGFIASEFYLLIQKTNLGELPTSNDWKMVNMTSGTTKVGGLINPSSLVGKSFIVDFNTYDNASFYDIESFMGLVPDESNSLIEPGLPQFGDEQPFPGSIRLVRATDIEKMNFMVNLPSSQFLTTQNPTYITGQTKRITEVALLNENKEVLVIGKVSNPIKRSGTQVFAVKIDF